MVYHKSIDSYRLCKLDSRLFSCSFLLVSRGMAGNDYEDPIRTSCKLNHLLGQILCRIILLSFGLIRSSCDDGKSLSKCVMKSVMSFFTLRIVV